MSSVVIIIEDKLEKLLEKGEIIDKYYNPENYFKNVYLVVPKTTSLIDLNDVQKMVGSAQLSLLYYKQLPHRMISIFLPSFLVELIFYTKIARKISSEINFNLIRTYSIGSCTFLAKCIKRYSRKPMIISLHAEPFGAIETDHKGKKLEFLKILMETLYWKKIIKYTKENSDLALAVYESIINTFKNYNFKRYELAYNMINPKIKEKTSYEINKKHIKLLWVGRHASCKQATRIIDAIANDERFYLTCFGDGPLFKEVEKKCEDLNILNKRIFLHKSIKNDDLATTFKNYDMFTVHNDYQGISKSLLEAMAAGLPCITNMHEEKKYYINEYSPEYVEITDGSVLKYREAIERLANDHELRERLGKNAMIKFRNTWSYDVTSKVQAKYNCEFSN